MDSLLACCFGVNNVEIEIPQAPNTPAISEAVKRIFESFDSKIPDEFYTFEDKINESWASVVKILDYSEAWTLTLQAWSVSCLVASIAIGSEFHSGMIMGSSVFIPIFCTGLVICALITGYLAHNSLSALFANLGSLDKALSNLETVYKWHENVVIKMNDELNNNPDPARRQTLNDIAQPVQAITLWLQAGDNAIRDIHVHTSVKNRDFFGRNSMITRFWKNLCLTTSDPV